MLEYLEQCFLEAGTERMSKYFGEEVFENGLAAEHIFWNKDDLYYIIENSHKDKFEIKYSTDLVGEYQIYDLILINMSKEKIRLRIQELVDGWTPAEEKILSKYIDVYAREPFPITIQGVFIHFNKLEERRFRYIESDNIDYTYDINIDMDNLLEEYYELLGEENYHAAIILLNDLIQQSCTLLGEENSNTVALIYKLRDFAEAYLSEKEILKANLVLYQFNKKIHGNTHRSTLCIITRISYWLAELEEYNDAILLAKYVQKLTKKKYGNDSKENINAIGVLMYYYFDFGYMGKAISCAEECLNLCMICDSKRVRLFKQDIAMIYRHEVYSDYEKALQYDIEAFDELEDNTTISEDIIDSMRYIAEDYMLLDRMEEAANIQSELTEMAIDYYGSDHPRTLMYFSNLSLIMTELGHFEDALKFSEYVFLGYYRLYGKFHEKTMRARDDLIIDLVNNNQREYAMKMAGGTYMERLEELGAEHEATQISRQQYLDLRDGKW